MLSNTHLRYNGSAIAYGNKIETYLNHLEIMCVIITCESRFHKSKVFCVLFIQMITWMQYMTLTLHTPTTSHKMSRNC